MNDILFLVLMANICVAPHLSKKIATTLGASHAVIAFGFIIFEIYKRTAS